MMSSRSLAQGLRAALAGHEGTPLYRCALDALNAYARLGAACSELRLSLPPSERGLLTEFGETVFDDGRDFAVAWNTEPGEEKPDVFVDASLDQPSPERRPMSDGALPRFYRLDLLQVHAKGAVDILDLLAMVPDDHWVIDVSPWFRFVDDDGSPLLHEDRLYGFRAYVDRRPPWLESSS